MSFITNQALDKWNEISTVLTKLAAVRELLGTKVVEKNL